MTDQNEVQEDQVEEATQAQEPELEINLPPMSYGNLEKVHSAVTERMREKRDQERALDINTIKVLLAKHPSIKWNDIKPEKVAKVAPKYRNPNDPSQTWTGRGKPPLWIKDAEDRTAFLID